jgi:hypothetical protein
MDPEEIVHCGLGMKLLLPPFSNLDGIHQVKCPEVVVDIDELRVGAAEPGGFIVEKAIHFRSFCGEHLPVFLNDFPRHRGGCVRGIVHRPGYGSASVIAGDGESVMPDAAVILSGSGWVCEIS